MVSSYSLLVPSRSSRRDAVILECPEQLELSSAHFFLQQTLQNLNSHLAP